MRLALTVASFGLVGLVPMATAALIVALIGVLLATLALTELREHTAEVRRANCENRVLVSEMATDLTPPPHEDV